MYSFKKKKRRKKKKKCCGGVQSSNSIRSRAFFVFMVYFKDHKKEKIGVQKCM